MTIEQIEKFLSVKKTETPIQIRFKTRKTMTGLFIKGNDYDYLKSKNFWRIVGDTNVEKFNNSNNTEFSRIFNGTEFVKLENA